MTEKEKAIEWLKACKETNYRHSATIQGYMDMAISALSENKREWIPTIERLPENGELVLCSVANSNYSVIINCVDKNQSYWHNGRIYAWQPLPEPYKGGE